LEKVMSQNVESAPSGLLATLRDIVNDARRQSGAEIVSLYLFDAASQSYYAPVAEGIPEDGLLGSLSDMRDQLARYRADVGQGKAPAELRLNHYGPNVWLTVTRQRLYTHDAPKDIDSSFIRRHRIQTVLGLPLLSGNALIGLLYLDFVRRSEADGETRPNPTLNQIVALEAQAAEAALAIERAGAAEERVVIAAVGQLAAQLATPSDHPGADANGFRRRLDQALDLVRPIVGGDAVAIYEIGQPRGRLELVSESGLPGAGLIVDVAAETGGSLLESEAIQRELAGAGQYLVASLPLRLEDRRYGYLFVFSRDRLAYLRRAPLAVAHDQTLADLIAGAVANHRLVASLEDANRVLETLSRTSSALLTPGATRQQVLDAIVRHLTDKQVSEFDFKFATVFLLDDAAAATPTAARAGNANPLIVRLAAGAATDSSIEAVASDPATPNGEPGRLVPRWSQARNRVVASEDVLAFVARSWQTVVVGAAPSGGASEPDEFVARFPGDQIEKHNVPAIRADGTVCALVPTVLVHPGVARSQPAETAAATAPFTLDGDVFESNRHQDLIRVFVPFGLDPATRASGVLEAGYHRSHKRLLDRTSVDALRACAAQVAVAVETARLYEEVKRHADQLELLGDVSKAIASSIDLDQTLRLIARNMVRLIDASLCQIALYEQNGSAWYGAAASDAEEAWRRMRGERPEASFLFEVLDRGAPLVVDDALGSDLINPLYARQFGIRSLLVLPLFADDQPIGAVILGQRDRQRSFTAEEVQQTSALAHQAAIALKNARQHALSEEEHHIQKDVILVGFGQWAQKAYQHLLTLKQFFNFKTHVVTPDRGEAKRAAMADTVKHVVANGDAFYWDSPAAPAREQLRRQLESSCYVISYVATPAATHLPVVAQYYDLSNVIVIEKPLGATPEAYREFLDSVDGSVEIVAADHYYFKLEVRLLELLLTEEKTLKTFLDTVEEIEIELLEEKPLDGAAAEIGIIADMIPHAFAIVSLFTPIDRIQLVTETTPLAIGRQQPVQGEKETYVRLVASFPHQGRLVRLVIVAGKGVENAKWIKLSGEQRVGGRRAFYKFDFGKGEAIDGTQTNLRAAIRPIREAGVPDTAHLSMLRHILEKRHPAVGILAIREAIRSNQRIQELEAIANDLLARSEWTPYQQGQRPDLGKPTLLRAVAKATTANGSVAQAR
jgi:GAF domain-containing protein